MDIEKIKKLRAQTGAGMADCKKALEETKGDLKQAKEFLRKKGFEKAVKKAERETAQGLVASYIHANGKIGVLVQLQCETDFVARTDEFQTLAQEIAMQIAAMSPTDVADLLKQPYIRDAGQTIETLIKETIGKLGENIQVARFARFALGEK